MLKVPFLIDRRLLGTMQEMSWGSLMSAVGEGMSGEKRAWAQDRAGIKERWRQISTALTELRDTQSAWTIPDASLRANMKDAVAEDFVPLYKVSCLDEISLSR